MFPFSTSDLLIPPPFPFSSSLGCSLLVYIRSVVWAVASHLAAGPSLSLVTTLRIHDCSPDVSGSSKFHRLCKVLVVKLQTCSFLVAVLVFFPFGQKVLTLAA